MSANGQLRDTTADGQVLRWPDRMVTAAALRTRFTGQRELLLPERAIITPLAAEQLRANGVQVRHEPTSKQAADRPNWGYAQDRAYPLVQSAVQALEREGVALKKLDQTAGESACRWSQALARCIAEGDCAGGIAFCEDPGLVCCVANKLRGLRSVAVSNLAQAARARMAIGANLVVVEMPGRTFFEVRQILRMLCVPGTITCPPGLACTLQELDGHAHR